MTTHTSDEAALRIRRACEEARLVGRQVQACLQRVDELARNGLPSVAYLDIVAYLRRSTATLDRLVQGGLADRAGFVAVREEVRAVASLLEVDEEADESTEPASPN
ncbi:MAG: hypothetical protein DWQ36_19640 [Acidobacteria bacterium]|nr:MAG: hypothetical protein DWQ30_06000 [Acidobacteriota bacterium]REK03754.1 MAG: hypothetical protein DWQ36_19640 [Acidobacteriota bacterium]